MKHNNRLLFGWDADQSGPATVVNNHARTLITEFRVGGIIFMGRNIAGLDAAAVSALTTELQDRARAEGLPPLIICTDQEGGRVARFRPPHFSTYPSAWSIGEMGDETLAYANAEAIGRELKNVGVNWTLAPVLDVNNNPKNPVIGNRSFGADATRTARLGAAAVRGFQEGARIAACGKHFPGHGDTDIDSHKALPRIAHGRARLDAIELAPFRAAIDAGIAAIMTSHILFEAMDSDLPVTLSPTIIQGLLRGELGYDGVVITDDLDMRGVAAQWGAPEAAVLAAIAGADLLLCCHGLETQRAVVAALDNAEQSGRISAGSLRAARARIENFKTRWVQ